MKKLILAIFLGVSIFKGGLVLSASGNDMEATAADTAVVELSGEPLFQVRGMAGYTAETRAHAIETRIIDAARNPAISPNSIAIVDLADRTNILAGDTILVSILDADGATEGMPRAVLAQAAQRNITRAIETYRHDRTATVLLRRTAVAGAATLGLFVLLFAFGRLYKLAIASAERHLKTRMDSLEERSSKVIESRPLWTAILGIMGVLRIIALGVLFYFYLSLVLGLFPWTRPLAVRLFSIFIAPLNTLGEKFVGALPDVAFLIIFSIIIRYVLKITRLFFNGIAAGTIVIKAIEHDLALPTYRIVRFLILCFAAVVAYPYIPGSNSDAFKGVSLFVGVLVSLGSTSLISNLIASIALTYRRAFKVGDIIKVNDVMGLVTDMRLQATHIRTRHNESVIIPNSVIVNSHVINYSQLAKKDGVLLYTSVGIGYGTPWRQVEAMLLMAADRTPGLKPNQKPFVRQRSLDTFSIQYELNVYCDDPLTMWGQYDNLHKNVLDVFNEYGVQIMTPAYEGDPENLKIVPKDQINAVPAKKLNG